MIDATEEKFSLVIGGPFYRLQQRLGLLGADNLPPWRTALLFSLVAWLPPAIFSVMQGFAWGGVLGERAFFLDFSVHARFFVAVLMFTVMESIAERRIAAIIPQFNKAGLVPPDEQQRFSAALARADRRSSSSLAELVVLVHRLCGNGLWCVRASVGYAHYLARYAGRWRYAVDARGMVCAVDRLPVVLISSAALVVAVRRVDSVAARLGQAQAAPGCDSSR